MGSTTFWINNRLLDFFKRNYKCDGDGETGTIGVMYSMNGLGYLGLVYR